MHKKRKGKHEKKNRDTQEYEANTRKKYRDAQETEGDTRKIEQGHSRKRRGYT